MKVDVNLANKTKVPAHETVYRKLRDLVLFGEIAPGQAVTIQGLTDQLDAGMTPTREAIRRLIAEGALNFMGNRRVCVPNLSVQNVNELIFARQVMEPKLILLATLSAMRAGDAEKAARSIREDVIQGMEQVRRVMKQTS